MLKIDAKNYRILVDSREKDLFIPQILNRNGIATERKKLDTGDYAIQYKNGYIPGIVIERKSCIEELLSNLTDNRKDKNGNNRFQKELERAKAQGLKVYLLIEDENFYTNIIKGNYRNKINPNAAKGMIFSLEAKFRNLSIVWMNKKEMPGYIHTILYYKLRQDLKEMENYMENYEDVLLN